MVNAVNISVCMLGEFSIGNGSARLSDSGSRSKNIWLLLAYILYNRERSISSGELTELLGMDEHSSNPLNALKTTFHRLRTELEKLGADVPPLIRKGSACTWNPQVSVTLDAEEFDRLVKAGAKAESEDEKLQLWSAALALYRDDFLPRFSSEMWVVPIAAYYHNLYVQTVLSLLELLEARNDWAQAEALCRAAIGVDRYQEDFYRHLMSALIRQNRHVEAVAVYEELRDLFLSTFCVAPSEALQALHRSAVSASHETALPLDDILAQLAEPEGPGGALICDWDVFKTVYRTVARLVVRSGETAHLALISVQARNGGALSRRVLERVSENLLDLLRGTLRRGDAAAQCSASQFVLLLPRSNFENSRMVCDRLIRAFSRQHPHATAILHATVHPLEPNV